ncbi:YrdB family protein [Microbacterium sp. LRZ72]|uniref:YrdB family protein n=1 Tax=Microbacterium sp. LRZ72 TaxID=2942481 RepID=UPI0029BE055B|nr:YrdB family protein [Microbacterium sp. LRZ72]MDX2375987.1 YrdB family protein [Microbacterium sp. LRZ72]
MSDSPTVHPTAPEQPRPDGSARPAGTVARPTALDVVRLLTEIVAVGSLAFWGFVSFVLPWNIVAGIGAPALAILVWALFVSPRAVLAVHPFVAALVELLIFASVTLAWWSLGQPWVGLAFGVVAVTAGVLVGRRRFA